MYLSLLQLVGIILAFQTRKVRIPILNDSKSVAALIYISSIVLVVIVLITFILRGYLNVSAAMFYGGIILLATIFLIFIFIPKVKMVIQKSKMISCGHKQPDVEWIVNVIPAFFLLTIQGTQEWYVIILLIIIYGQYILFTITTLPVFYYTQQ